jgi:hypothetical protein
LLTSGPVQIRFTSTLSAEDENKLAPAVIEVLAGILDILPIAYVVQIETSDLRLYQAAGPVAVPLVEPAVASSLPGPTPYES